MLELYDIRIELFMRYVNENGMIFYNSLLKFCEICSDIRDNRSIKYWFLWQIFRNVDELRLFVSRYEVNYPGLIKTIDALIEDCTLSMGCEFLLEEEKVKLFMNYFNDNNIFSFKYKLSFVDIGAKDNSYSVKKWFNIQLNYNFDWFVSEVSKYASIYPKIYKIVNYYYICSGKERIRKNKL